MRTIKITEETIRQIVRESLDRILNENWVDDPYFGKIYVSDKSLDSMERAFTPKRGEEFLKDGAKVIRGEINPNMLYVKGYYNWERTNLFADVIIEYPDGRRCVLMKK